MSRLAFLGAIVLAACGPKGGGAATDPCKDPCAGKKAAMTCDQMAANITTAMRTSGEFSDEVLAGMEGMFAAQCTDMAWSQDTIDCMGMAANEDDGERCMAAMTPEQQESLDEAFDAAEGAEE